MSRRTKCDYCGITPESIYVVQLDNNESIFCCDDCVDADDVIINAVENDEEEETES